LESVGRLAAGIAHEINTPVQFVSDSLFFLRDASAELFSVVERLEAVRAAVAAGEPAAAFAAAALDAEEEADLPYLLDQVPRAFERSMDGLQRVASIVRSMKEFAHPDQKEMTAVDLNRSIQSTLIVGRTEYKYVADLETDLGELPPVMCYAGEINQAVLNIVTNAAHAIGDVAGDNGPRGLITVRTRCEGNDVVVQITDTGGGIPAWVADRIFDPFFTTKAVGKGTGQGLAIARAVIVEKHRGQLRFDTTPGKGTTFTISIPIGHPPEPLAISA
jgi:signal transduction histidine kinase